jgi:hypothetical protein
MGWSNDIPDPFIVGGGGQSGEIDIVNATNQVFMFMNEDGFFLVDPNTNALLATIAPTNEDLPVYGETFAGIFTYDPNGTDISTGLTQGQLQFRLRNQAEPFFYGTVAATNPAAASIGPSLSMTAPSTNAGPDQAFVEVDGNSEDGTDVARIILGKTVPGDVEILTWGGFDYGSIGSTTPEPWHTPTLNTNWGNTAGYGVVKYKRVPVTQGGLIVFTGVCQWNSVATGGPLTIFTLPEAYRPTTKKRLITIDSPGAGTAPTAEAIEVLTTGEVQITSYVAGTGPKTPITFDNLSFYLGV